MQRIFAIITVAFSLFVFSVDLNAGDIVEIDPDGDPLSVIVDYDKSVEEMVGAGQYNGGVHPSINSINFPTDMHGKHEVLIHFVRFTQEKMTPDEILDRLAQMGFRPVALRELLALNAAFPDLFKGYYRPINALGSIWEDPGGIRVVPTQQWFSDERFLLLKLHQLPDGYGGLYSEDDGYWHDLDLERFAVISR